MTALADYLMRVVVLKLNAVAGVQTAEVLRRTFALRAWPDPTRMALPAALPPPM